MFSWRVIHAISADGLLTTLSIQLNMDKAAISTVQLKLVLTELSQAYFRHIAVGVSFASNIFASFTSMYKVIFTSAKAKLLVLGGWIAALSTPLTYTAAGKDYVFQPGKFFCYFESRFSLLILPFYIFIGISMVILIVCYLRVFQSA